MFLRLYSLQIASVWNGYNRTYLPYLLVIVVILHAITWWQDKQMQVQVKICLAFVELVDVVTVTVVTIFNSFILLVAIPVGSFVCHQLLQRFLQACIYTLLWYCLHLLCKNSSSCFHQIIYHWKHLSALVQSHRQSFATYLYFSVLIMVAYFSALYVIILTERGMECKLSNKYNYYLRKHELNIFNLWNTVLCYTWVFKKLWV